MAAFKAFFFITVVWCSAVVTGVATMDETVHSEHASSYQMIVNQSPPSSGDHRDHHQHHHHHHHHAQTLAAKPAAAALAYKNQPETPILPNNGGGSDLYTLAILPRMTMKHNNNNNKKYIRQQPSNFNAGIQYAAAPIKTGNNNYQLHQPQVQQVQQAQQLLQPIVPFYQQNSPPVYHRQQKNDYFSELENHQRMPNSLGDKFEQVVRHHHQQPQQQLHNIAPLPVPVYAAPATKQVIAFNGQPPLRKSSLASEVSYVKFSGMGASYEF